VYGGPGKCQGEMVRTRARDKLRSHAFEKKAVVEDGRPIRAAVRCRCGEGVQMVLLQASWEWGGIVGVKWGGKGYRARRDG